MPPPLRFLAAACLLASVTPGRAADFSWEVSGAATHAELDPVFDSDRSAVTATYYFGTVDDALGPLALASFLSPVTRLSASVSRTRQDAHGLFAYPAGIFPDDSAADFDDYAVGGRYVLPGAKWYTGGSYTNGDVEARPGLLIDAADSHDYGLFAGRYFGSNTSLELTLGRAEKGTEGRGIACVIGLFCAAIVPQTTTTTADTASLDLLNVRHFESLTYVVSARIEETSGRVVIDSGSFEFPLLGGPIFPPPPAFGPVPSITVPARTTEISLDRFRVYSAAGELFPTRKIGIRLGYSRWDGAVSIDHAYDVAATWFVTRNVGLRLTFAEQRADDNAIFRTTDTTALQVLGRF